MPFACVLLLFCINLYLLMFTYNNIIFSIIIILILNTQNRCCRYMYCGTILVPISGRPCPLCWKLLRERMDYLIPEDKITECLGFIGEYSILISCLGRWRMVEFVCWELLPIVYCLTHYVRRVQARDPLIGYCSDPSRNI